MFGGAYGLSGFFLKRPTDRCILPGSFSFPDTLPLCRAKKAELPMIIPRQLGHASTCSASVAFRPLLAEGLALSGMVCLVLFLSDEGAYVKLYK
jgi:hypothetical protein